MYYSGVHFMTDNLLILMGLLKINLRLPHEIPQKITQKNNLMIFLFKITQIMTLK